LCIHSAQADSDGHDRVGAVVRSVQTQLEFELVDFPGQLPKLAFGLAQDGLVVFEGSQLDQLERVAGTPLDVEPRLQLFAERRKLAHYLLGGGLVRPEIGRSGLVFELRQACLFARRVKDAPGASRCGREGSEARRSALRQALRKSNKRSRVRAFARSERSRVRAFQRWCAPEP